MTRDFSDAPLTVDGVTIKPNFKWSAGYRDHVAETMRQAGKSDIEPEETERRYVEWYAAKNGLTIKQAREKIMPGGA